MIRPWRTTSASRSRTADSLATALETVLAKSYWLEINRLLAPFGKSVCTWTAPKYSVCPLSNPCPKIGVTEYR